MQWETGETIEEQEFSLVDVRAAVFFENNDEDGAVILRHTLTTNRLTKNRLHILATRACKRGYVACLRLLLNARANPNFKPKDLEQEQSLLHHAAYNGHVECVKILLTGEPPGRGEPADLLFRNKFNEDAVDAANARLRKVNGAIRRGFDDDDDNDDRLRKFVHAFFQHLPFAPPPSTCARETAALPAGMHVHCGHACTLRLGMAMSYQLF